MTKIFLMSVLAVLLIGRGAVWMSAKASGAELPAQKTITLTWDYPESELSTNLTFKIYNTTDMTIPISDWNVMHVVGTQTWAKFPVSSDSHFFVITASNVFGESGFGN